MKPTLVQAARGLLRAAGKLPAIVGALPHALSGARETHDSVGAMLARNAARDPSGTAVRDVAGPRLSHHALNAWANRIAHALVARGVTAGEPVGLWVSNRVELLALCGGIAKVGAVAVMGNTNQRGRSLAHSLAVALDGGARLIVASDDLVAPVADVLPSHESLVSLESFWEEAGRCSSREPASTKAVRLADPFLWIFTSGTTGLPKASVMTHGRWRKASAVYGSVMLDVGADDVVYSALPLYHSLALVSAWSACVRTGACLAIRRSFSASAFWDDCRTVGATAIAYIGEIPRYLLAQPERSDDAEHRVRKALGVGLRPELWAPFRDRFGLEAIYEHYGASESNSIFVNLLGLDATVGFCPTPHALVRYDRKRDEIVRDSAGRAQRVVGDEPGLLLLEVTERFSFDGYTDAAASEAKLVRGVFEGDDVWFNSGDLLRRVGFGHVQFVDRLGDTFRWKSENVATREVEAVLDRHPQVAESTVYGVSLPQADGKAGMAALVVDSEQRDVFDWAALERLCAEELPAYARPVFVRFIEQVALTGTFKHRRFLLAREGIEVEGVYFVEAGGHYRPLEPADRPRVAAGSLRL